MGTDQVVTNQGEARTSYLRYRTALHHTPPLNAVLILQFAKMSDFAVTCLVGGRLYAGLNARSARKFVARVKSVCGRSVSQL